MNPSIITKVKHESLYPKKTPKKRKSIRNSINDDENGYIMTADHQSRCKEFWLHDLNPITGHIREKSKPTYDNSSELVHNSARVNGALIY